MSKIDRIIIALTKNPNYIGFWNYTSKIWKTKFKLKPTLFFYGTQKELNDCDLSPEFGEINLLERCDEVTLDTNLEWACTWGLFYGASLYKTETCMLCGIDQIPLNGNFFDFYKNINESKEKYVVGFADAYHDFDLNPLTDYPSSHHVATGQKFKEIYEIDDDWFIEIKKVFNKKNNFKILSQNCWGLDECYSSSILRSRIANSSDIVLMKIFHKYWKHHRLDRSNMEEFKNVNLNKIKNNFYCEFHANRPFENNGIELMNEIYKEINEYEW
jgi:hypothetical protein